jgi:chromosome segregation ATPase
MDQQKYINTYVDKSVGMLHEYVSIILQLRTQLHIANDLIKEKDQVISDLQEKAQQFNNDAQELDTAKNNARSWEDQYNAMKNKLSHMDTLTNQINEMKQALISKNTEADNLKRESDGFKHEADNLKIEIGNLKRDIESKQKQIDEPNIPAPAPKKAINSKSTIKPVSMKKVEEPPKVETDDDF